MQKVKKVTCCYKLCNDFIECFKFVTRLFVLSAGSFRIVETCYKFLIKVENRVR